MCTVRMAQTHTVEVYSPRRALRHDCIGTYASMKTVVSQLLNTDTLLEALTFIEYSDRDCFKKRSYDGAVFIKGRNVDLGNYCYSVLWHMCVDRARRQPESQLCRIMESLISKYPSLDVAIPPDNEWYQWESYNSMELKGDVIEVLLAFARLTGSAIPAARRKDRLAVNHLV